MDWLEQIVLNNSQIPQDNNRACFRDPSLKSSINEGEVTMLLQEVKSDMAKYYE